MASKRGSAVAGSPWHVAVALMASGASEAGLSAAIQCCEAEAQWASRPERLEESTFHTENRWFSMVFHGFSRVFLCFSSMFHRNRLLSSRF